MAYQNNAQWVINKFTEWINECVEESNKHLSQAQSSEYDVAFENNRILEEVKEKFDEVKYN